MKQFLLMAIMFLTSGAAYAQKNQNPSKKLTYKTYSRTEKDGTKTYLDINNEKDSLGMREFEITSKCEGKIYSNAYKFKGNTKSTTMIGIVKGEIFTIAFDTNKVELKSNNLIPENYCKDFDGVYILEIKK